MTETPNPAPTEQRAEDLPHRPEDSPRRAGDSPHKAAEDREEVYFDGSPMLRSQAGSMARWFGLGLVLMGAPVVILAYQGNAPWVHVWWMMVLFALGAGAFAMPFWVARSTRYRITNYRIDYERGLLSKRIDTLELWHVEDISFYQSLLNRILNVGTITVISKDATNPRLELKGIPQPRPIYENLKQRVIAVKRQRGVVKMDVG